LPVVATGAAVLWAARSWIGVSFQRPASTPRPSTAAQLNSELLGPVARWLVQSLVYLPAGALIDHAFTTALLESTEGRAAVRDFLATADISITEVSAVPRKGLRGQVMFQPGADGAQPYTNMPELVNRLLHLKDQAA
jgi:hypothetical protein